MPFNSGKGFHAKRGFAPKRPREIEPRSAPKCANHGASLHARQRPGGPDRECGQCCAIGRWCLGTGCTVRVHAGLINAIKLQSSDAGSFGSSGPALCVPIYPRPHLIPPAHRRVHRRRSIALVVPGTKWTLYGAGALCDSWLIQRKRSRGVRPHGNQ